MRKDPPRICLYSFIFWLFEPAVRFYKTPNGFGSDLPTLAVMIGSQDPSPFAQLKSLRKNGSTPHKLPPMSRIKSEFDLFGRLSRRVRPLPGRCGAGFHRTLQAARRVSEER